MVRWSFRLFELLHDTVGALLTTAMATTAMMDLGQAFMLTFIPQGQIQQQIILKLGWSRPWISKFEMDLIPSSLYSTFPVWFPYFSLLLGQCLFTGRTIDGLDTQFGTDCSDIHQSRRVLLVQLFRQGGAASGGVGEAGGLSRERDR